MRECICGASNRKIEFIGDKCVNCYVPSESIVNTNIEVGDVILEFTPPVSEGKYGKCKCGNKIIKRNASGKCGYCLRMIAGENRAIKMRVK